MQPNETPGERGAIRGSAPFACEHVKVRRERGQESELRVGLGVIRGLQIQRDVGDMQNCRGKQKQVMKAKSRHFLMLTRPRQLSFLQEETLPTFSTSRRKITARCPRNNKRSRKNMCSLSMMMMVKSTRFSRFFRIFFFSLAASQFFSLDSPLLPPRPPLPNLNIYASRMQENEDDAWVSNARVWKPNKSFSRESGSLGASANACCVIRMQAGTLA